MPCEQPQMHRNIIPEEENKNKEEKKSKASDKLPPGFSLEKLIKKEKKARSTWAMDSILPAYPGRKRRKQNEKAQIRAKIEAEGATPELQEFINNTLIPAWLEGVRDSENSDNIKNKILNVIPNLEQQLKDFIKQKPDVHSPRLGDIVYLAKHLERLSQKHNLTAEEYKYLGTILTPLLNIYYSSLPEEEQTEPINLSQLFNTTSQNYLCSNLKNGNISAEEAGDYFGYQTAGGMFNVKEARDRLGESATGGTFNVKKAGNELGYKVAGGTFNVKEAGDRLGESATGGTFNVEKARDSLGLDATGGTFNVEKARDRLGYKAAGGTFNVEKARYWLGESAAAGTFNVEKAGGRVW